MTELMKSWTMNMTNKMFILKQQRPARYIYISMHPVIITCFKWLEDILTNRSFFFQPSGSSKSSGNRTKRGPNKKLKEGVKYNIEAVRPNGEPLAPKKIADKFVRQCGVLVKDQLPISLQEWREPAKPRPDVTFVDKNQKDLLWDTLMEHFTLPDHFTEEDV